MAGGALIELELALVELSGACKVFLVLHIECLVDDLPAGCCTRLTHVSLRVRRRHIDRMIEVVLMELALRHR